MLPALLESSHYVYRLEYVLTAGEKGWALPSPLTPLQKISL